MMKFLGINFLSYRTELTLRYGTVVYRRSPCEGSYSWSTVSADNISQGRNLVRNREVACAPTDDSHHQALCVSLLYLPQVTILALKRSAVGLKCSNNKIAMGSAQLPPRRCPASIGEYNSRPSRRIPRGRQGLRIPGVHGFSFCDCGKKGETLWRNLRSKCMLYSLEPTRKSCWVLAVARASAVHYDVQ